MREAEWALHSLSVHEPAFSILYVGTSRGGRMLTGNNIAPHTA